MLSIFNKKGVIKKMGNSKITIEDIEFVNTKLSEGASLNSLDKDRTLKMSRKAFKNNALKLSYIYDAELNKFIKDENIVSNTTVTRSNKQVAIKKTDNKEDKIKELENRIKALEDIVLLNNTNVTFNDFELDSRVLNNDIITRSIKVSKTAINAFNNVAENKLNMYSKQLLISQALLEFAEKYNK